MDMILATHIVIAAALTKPLAASHPLFAFSVALASHYAADAVPHWHYTTRTILKTKDPTKRVWQGTMRMYIADILAFATDAGIGIGAIYLLTQPVTAQEWLWFGAAIGGSILPDFLQGLYMAGAKILRPHQIIHHRIHTKILLDAYPWIGIPFQAAIAIAAALFI